MNDPRGQDRMVGPGAYYGSQSPEMARYKWMNIAMIVAVLIAGAAIYHAASVAKRLDVAPVPHSASIFTEEANAQTSASTARSRDEEVDRKDKELTDSWSTGAAEPTVKEPASKGHYGQSAPVEPDKTVTFNGVFRVAPAADLSSGPGYKVASSVPPALPPAPPEEDTFELQLDQPGSHLDLTRRDIGAPTPRPAAAARTSDFSRALAFHRGKDYPKAVEYYERAIAQQPNHLGSYNNLGVLYMQTGDFEKAVATLSQAVAINPDDSLVHSNIATCHMKLGRYDEAVQALNETLRLEPDSLPALTNMGIAKSAMGEFGDARRYLERAAAAHPGEPRTEFNLGNLFRRMGDKPSAVRHYLKFLELSAGRYPEQEAQVNALIADTGSWH